MSILKIVGGMSSVLCASLSGTPQAEETINPKECSELKGGHRDLVQCEEDKKQSIDTVKGEYCTSEKVSMWFRDPTVRQYS